MITGEITAKNGVSMDCEIVKVKLLWLLMQFNKNIKEKKKENFYDVCNRFRMFS